MGKIPALPPSTWRTTTVRGEGGGGWGDILDSGAFLFLFFFLFLAISDFLFWEFFLFLICIAFGILQYILR